MTNQEFLNINDFEEIINNAKDLVEHTSKNNCLNFSLKVSFPIKLVENPQLLDYSDLAEDFQKIEKPDRLYINHGQFIGFKGIAHIINEIKNKENSNRALFSLINQANIIESGDNPIPSFMTLQFCLESEMLFVTSYFRALEVSKFLKINIEEIRLIIREIYTNIPSIKEIKLNLFAFRAYINSNINTLIRPEIEIIDSVNLYEFMRSNPKKIANLLKEKLNESTVIEFSSFKSMLKFINDPGLKENLAECFKSDYIKSLLEDCFIRATEIHKLRINTSHNIKIEELNSDYSTKLKTLIKGIEDEA